MNLEVPRRLRTHMRRWQPESWIHGRANCEEMGARQGGNMSWNATRIDHLSIGPRVPNPVRGKPLRQRVCTSSPLTRFWIVLESRLSFL